MKKLLHLTIAALVLMSSLGIGSLSAQTKPIDKVELEKKIDSLFKDFNNTSSPGYAITVIQNGKVITKKDYGLASLEHKVSFTHNTVVTIPYSEGREFISLAAALMEQDGKLTLEDKVRKYFPKLPAWSEPVTIQDLLNHSSGFCDEWATLVLTQASMNNRLDVSQFLNFLYNQPDPQVQPGKGYMYSNSDFGLLRLILEKASGEKLPDYIERRIFKPLQMSSSTMRRDKEAVLANHAFSYFENGQGTYKVWLRDKTSPGGNYHTLTSASDLEKWAAAFEDKNSFITKASERLKKNARPIPVLKETNYAHGHKLKKLGVYEIILHEGVTGYSYLARIPTAGLDIICTTNNQTEYDGKVIALATWLLHIDTKTKLPQQKFSSTPVSINEKELQKYAGRYLWLTESFQSIVKSRTYYAMKVKGDTLYWQYSSTESVPLMYVGDGIFKDPDFAVWLRFFQPHPDSTMRIEAHKQFGEPEIDTWRKDSTVEPIYSREYLQKLSGKYYSKHLDFYFTIMLNDEGKLVVKRPTIADKVLEPFSLHEFKLPTEFFESNYESSFRVHFYFNDAGMPTHFDVHHGRLMHHRFDKIQ
ncbi:MAG TPA: serine hydrolase domain-containing protein [Chryseolinea sp.]|nr:serine hydrolase domain-containing protein [Chryseolinea sp.]HPM29696.1 serine hydrolase domain-containing protein [Chryseolinea sp.]